MPRVFSLCMMAALTCSCGEASRDTAPANPPAPDSAVQVPASTATASVMVAGPPRRNRFLQLAVTGAGFDPAGPAPPPGLRHYTVGLRGISRSRNDVALEIKPFVFAQNERGCISRPESGASWLTHPLGDTAVFTAAHPTEGQLAFLMPEDTQRVRVLVAPASEDGFAVPAGEDFTPSWPAPLHTIEDGSTLRVLVLPRPARPAALPPPAAGREQVVLDFVIENLKTTQGIEFQTSQQLRLATASGAFVQPAASTMLLGCRLDDGDVIPPGHARRLMVVYDMSPGVPLRLQYRGFEQDEVSVELE